MDSLYHTVISPENLEYQRYLNTHVRLVDGSEEDELLVTIDDKLVASVEFTPQKMVVRDLEGKLIGFFDCPPLALKHEVLRYCQRRL